MLFRAKGRTYKSHVRARTLCAKQLTLEDPDHSWTLPQKPQSLAPSSPTASQRSLACPDGKKLYGRKETLPPCDRS